MNRLETVRAFVDEKLHRLTNLEDKRCGFVHLYGVSLTATQLAKRRGMNRELAGIAGMLHDIVSYESGDPTDHAARGAVRAAEILRELDLFADDEIDAIQSAIASHSDKASRGSAFQELLKDADVIQHHFYNTAHPPHPRHAERLARLADQDREASGVQRQQSRIAFAAADDLAEEEQATIKRWMASVWGSPGSDGFLWAGSQWHVILSVNDERVSHVGLLRREIRVADHPLTVGGVSGVTTMPAWRSNSYSSQTLGHAAELLREELALSFALLECEPDMERFYQRLGWRTLAEKAVCQLPEGEGSVPGHVAMVLELTEEEWPGGSINLLGKPW